MTKEECLQKQLAIANKLLNPKLKVQNSKFDVDSEYDYDAVSSTAHDYLFDLGNLIDDYMENIDYPEPEQRDKAVDDAFESWAPIFWSGRPSFKEFTWLDKANLQNELQYIDFNSKSFNERFFRYLVFNEDYLVDFSASDLRKSDLLSYDKFIATMTAIREDISAKLYILKNKQKFTH